MAARFWQARELQLTRGMAKEDSTAKQIERGPREQPREKSSEGRSPGLRRTDPESERQRRNERARELRSKNRLRRAGFR